MSIESTTDEAALPPMSCSALPVIIDPDYSRFLVKARIIAKQEGYALAVHGSMIRDLDVVAIPWTAECRKPINLLTRICFNSGLKMQDETPTIREHGRLVWSLLFPEFGDPRFVDFSVMPPTPKS